MNASSAEVLPIFVYGTLKRGQIRERCWPHSPVRIETATTLGRLFDVGPYPALLPGSRLVAGELWFVAAEHLEETLRVLDEIECYGNDDVDLYVRRIVPCVTESGRTERAYVYHFADEAELLRYPETPASADGLCRWPHPTKSNSERRVRLNPHRSDTDQRSAD